MLIFRARDLHAVKIVKICMKICAKKCEICMENKIICTHIFYKSDQPIYNIFHLPFLLTYSRTHALEWNGSLNNKELIKDIHKLNQLGDLFPRGSKPPFVFLRTFKSGRLNCRGAFKSVHEFPYIFFFMPQHVNYHRSW